MSGLEGYKYNIITDAVSSSGERESQELETALNIITDAISLVDARTPQKIWFRVNHILIVEKLDYDN